VFRVWMAALAAGVLAPVAAAEPDEALELKSAWVRALPPFQPNTSAYLTLVNSGEAAVAIVGASSDVAEKVEIHRTREVDGLMRMEQLDGLALAPGDQLELAPGGTHLMLLDLAYMPAPGDEVRLCVQLASGGEVCTVADVRKSAEAQGHQHHN